MLRQSDRQSDEIKHPTVCPTGRTKRLHNTIVGPTSRTDRSVRRSYRVNARLCSILLPRACLAVHTQCQRDHWSVIAQPTRQCRLTAAFHHDQHQ